MAEKDFTCRSCGRPIAVAMSTCPWPDCRATIMVICSACRSYTDDQGEFCAQCGEPLVAATFEGVELPIVTQSLLKQLVVDQERAFLVASGAIARYSDRFFGENAPAEGVLADLLGMSLNSRSRAAAVLFGAIAYLVQAGYCRLDRDPAAGSDFLWVETRDWEGQMDSLEAKMAAHAWQKAPLGEAIRHLIAGETGLHLDDQELDGSLPAGDQDTPLDHTPSWISNALNRLLERLPRRRARPRGIPSRPAAPTIVKCGWETVLPAHEETAACEEARQVMADFEEADSHRAQYVLDEIRQVLDWFERAEQDQQAEYRRRYAAITDASEDESTPGQMEDQMPEELEVDGIGREGGATPPLPASEVESPDGNSQ